jgi:hypothetical protein
VLPPNHPFLFSPPTFSFNFSFTYIYLRARQKILNYPPLCIYIEGTRLGGGGAASQGNERSQGRKDIFSARIAAVILFYQRSSFFFLPFVLAFRGRKDNGLLVFSLEGMKKAYEGSVFYHIASECFCKFRLKAHHIPLSTS